jgi:hypothetical protein
MRYLAKRIDPETGVTTAERSFDKLQDAKDFIPESKKGFVLDLLSGKGKSMSKKIVFER